MHLLQWLLKDLLTWHFFTFHTLQVLEILEKSLPQSDLNNIHNSFSKNQSSFIFQKMCVSWCRRCSRGSRTFWCFCTRSISLNRLLYYYIGLHKWMGAWWNLIAWKQFLPTTASRWYIPSSAAAVETGSIVAETHVICVLLLVREPANRRHQIASCDNDAQFLCASWSRQVTILNHPFASRSCVWNILLEEGSL